MKDFSHRFFHWYVYLYTDVYGYLVIIVESCSMQQGCFLSLRNLFNFSLCSVCVPFVLELNLPNLIWQDGRQQRVLNWSIPYTIVIKDYRSNDHNITITTCTCNRIYVNQNNKILLSILMFLCLCLLVSSQAPQSNLDLQEDVQVAPTQVGETQENEIEDLDLSSVISLISSPAAPTNTPVLPVIQCSPYYACCPMSMWSIYA